ncbi:Sodium/hydrogen exchanger family-domain-containing protein [Ilyonectria robusta]|uniref:Sodium/hydrogen exchanger family-domain-containing protein n=1 Tax=Ilyonectria robusta TaxID=1079257 RepID=UPI001E8CA40F|nr:Sodium/hydrogen exchanger family-domain-containing protein [Ilyonectria robusta]KAH8680185.1 Sodium/hydrogen exchanger family-domain-containing protein [Ilyonectria robusta]
MSRDIWAVPLQLNNFNIVLALLGGFISLFGLVSFLLKENYYLSEALISLLVGLAFGPNGADFIRPKDYAQCSVEGISDEDCQRNLNTITLNFSRLVLGVQLVLAGVQLPSKYLRMEWKSLSLLLGPGMTGMWIATSLLVWGLSGTSSVLHALAIGACVTPTDPVLSAVIVKGKFADQNIPKDLQDLIVAESGANDGLGYPFLFFALYLIKYVGSGATSGGAGDAMGLWFAYTWGYTIILSILYGAVVGWIAKELLHWAEEHNYVDRESFLVFAIALALFVLGTCGLVGTDDVLACFIAGNTFTWDDWFRLETKDDSLQPTIDMLLNVTIFLWYGAFLPWEDFGSSSVISTWRVVVLGLLVLLLRRLPWVFLMHKRIPQIVDTKQAIFVGFFGPIGVSAIFYLFITLEFIEEHLTDANGITRSDVKDLGELVRIIVWFLTVCSVVIHGLSIPLGKLGYLAPRRVGRVLSETFSDEPHLVEARRKIPIIGKYLVVEPKPRATGPVVILDSRPLHSRPVAPTSPADANAQTDATTGTDTPVVGESGTTTPRRDREIRFTDEVV